MDYILRDARKEEARELARLINFAGKGPQSVGLDYTVWSRSANEGQDPYDVGSLRVANEVGGYSYNNIRVIEADGKPAALAMSFTIVKKTQTELDQIDDLFRIFADLSQQAVGSYYLDSLAVSPEYRGHGFGRYLLEDTVDKAVKGGHEQISLLVFEKNQAALALYQKLGFKEQSKLIAPVHPSMPYEGYVILLSKSL
jgi:ribosomal protein S18 acetylase RimI-like enzyme